MVRGLVGLAQHQRAVAGVVAQFASLPPGAPVRLAKRTSNLFRPRPAAESGLDVRDLDGVISVDELGRTADVQGMCTYERLVEATLRRGLMPMVVPQLKTITVGGAVTGLGIESTSLWNGLPHESVLEAEILTGTGEIVTASPQRHAQLFDAFPNSYGCLGYALRLRIRLQPASRFVGLRHVRFATSTEMAEAIATIADTRAWNGVAVDFIDGVVFDRTQNYLTLGTWQDQGEPSDYTGQHIYYRSVTERARDCLTASDYLWRWDTDWFWCSAAFGAQRPAIRRLWPRRLRRSDVYHRLVGLENRYQVIARWDRWRGRPSRERVVQDVEVPLENLPEFLAWFDEHVGMSPVWICPLRTKREWPLYPLRPDHVYVNVGFWGTVAIQPGRQDGDVNRDIERAVAAVGGHKSLYSDVYYDRENFDAIYGGAELQVVKQRYDPDHRFTDMFDKVVNAR